MAHSLDLSVIAEGVETEQQRELLELYGCLHFQGYLFGKPMPVEQFEEIVRRVNADSHQ
jgi:EAL domain-containing protein (putative c-di-GMP-specific phosphodiesterase class I)